MRTISVVQFVRMHIAIMINEMQLLFFEQLVKCTRSSMNLAMQAAAARMQNEPQLKQ
jgi:hypothetical protein